MAARFLMFYSMLCISFAEENKWPPEDADLADDPSKWPGHMEYIGSKLSEKKMEIFKGFPSTDDFLNDYVIPSRAVQLKNAASKLISLPSFDDDFLLGLPYSYTTFVEAQSRANDKTKTNITVRQFLKKYKNEGLYLDTSIPVLVKSQISLPRSLKCESLIKEFKKSNLIFRDGEWHDPLRSKEENVIFCQLEGKTEFRLIESAVIRDRASILDRNNGTESGLNVRKADFTKYPSLREIPFYYKVTLNRTDCLFIPSKWLYQTAIDSRSVAVSIAWNRKLIVPSKKICGSPDDNNLAQFSFPEDNNETSFFSFFLLGSLHSFIEDYFPQPDSKLTYEQFEKKLREDDDLKDLVEWNEECNERAHEFFQQVDINQDNVLSPEDFDHFSKEDLEHMSGILSDRWEDFKDIVNDQNKEKTNKDSFMDIREALGRDYEKEIQDILEQGLNEILNENDMPEKLSFSKSAEPVIQVENEKNENEENIEEILAEDEEIKKFKELERKIKEVKRKKKETLNSENDHVHKDEL